MAEEEVEELQGLEAIGMGGEQAAKNTLEKRVGRKRRRNLVKKSGAKGLIGEWMIVDDFGDSFDFVSGF